MPAVQIFQGAVGKVQKGHGAVPPQGLGQKRPALGGGGPLGAAGNGQDLALEIAAPALGKAAAAQDHILRVVQAAGAGGDIGPHRFHIGQKARLGVGFAGGHGGQNGVGLGEIGQQRRRCGWAAAGPALPEVMVPLLVAAAIPGPVGAGQREVFGVREFVGHGQPLLSANAWVCHKARYETGGGMFRPLSGSCSDHRIPDPGVQP